jgi:hypothetical protein
METPSAWMFYTQEILNTQDGLFYTKHGVFYTQDGDAISMECALLVLKAIEDYAGMLIGEGH